MVTLNLQVGASTDDAQEIVVGGIIVTMTALELVFGRWLNARHIGYRFTGVSGLSGSAISAATLTFRAAISDAGSFVGDWYAHDAVAPGTFTTTTSNISDTAQRPRTTATCEGDGGDFGSWTSGQDETFTGDGINAIADIIQELANSYDPSTIALLHIYTSGTGERLAVSYDASSSQAAKLDITYTSGGGSPQTATPSPVTIPILVPDPELGIYPDPVTVPIVIPVPSVSGGAVKFPEPVTIPIVIPSPTLSAGAVTLAPDPVTVPVVIPIPAVTGTGVSEQFDSWGVITRLLDASQYALGTVFFLETGILTSAAETPVKARLFNVTDGVAVPGSEVTSTSTTYEVVRSSTFDLLALYGAGQKEYRLEFGGNTGGIFECHGGDIEPISS